MRSIRNVGSNGTARKQADVVYKQLDKEVGKKYFGKLVAIEPISKEYFIGKNSLEIILRARGKYPDRLVHIYRFGYKASGSMKLHRNYCG